MRLLRAAAPPAIARGGLPVRGRAKGVTPGLAPGRELGWADDAGGADVGGADADAGPPEGDADGGELPDVAGVVVVVRRGGTAAGVAAVVLGVAAGGTAVAADGAGAPASLPAGGEVAARVACVA